MKRIVTLGIILLIIASLCACKGGTSNATVPDTAENNQSLSETEPATEAIDLDYAKSNFTDKEAREYFSSHLEEYKTASANEIREIVSGRKWKVVEILEYGSWSGSFRFNSDGTIEETLYDGSVGYYNNRLWSISEDTLVLSSEKSPNQSFTIMIIDSYCYLGLWNGEPTLLLY